VVLVTQDQLSLDRLHLGRKNASISSPIRAHRKGHDETLIELKAACTRDRQGEWGARIVEKGSVCHAHVVSVAVAIPTQDGRGQLVTWSTRDFCDASRFSPPPQNRYHHFTCFPLGFNISRDSPKTSQTYFPSSQERVK
jgi:hypothetical protein